MKNTDEDLKKQKSFESKIAFREKKYLGYFESVKSVGRRSVNIYKVEGSERNISSAKLGVAFSNRDDEKRLFTGFHSRLVSDHVHQQ